jgi:hypothetical protein
VLEKDQRVNEQLKLRCNIGCSCDERSQVRIKKIVIVVVYKGHLSEKAGTVYVQTLQVQLHTATTAKTKSVLAAAPNLTT